MNIKDIAYICPSCKGSGKMYKDSHDCWGKPEGYYISCCTCKGYGFQLERGFLETIKKELKL